MADGNFSSRLYTLICVVLLRTCEGQRGLLYPPLMTQCTQGKVFSDCRPCPLTCDDFKSPAVCSRQTCVSGCFCPEGLAEFGGGCIDPSRCPDFDTATTAPYLEALNPYPYAPPTTDVYQPHPTTEVYQPHPTTEVYQPHPTTEVYQPHPYLCDLNEDEYGRPYYGPYDEYNGQQPYPPTVQTGTWTPTYANTGPRYTPETMSLPLCITSNECKLQPAPCVGTGTRYDRCGRRCTCRNGRLVNCCRVRKEWRSMSMRDRCRYVQVVYMASTQYPWKMCYDELIKIHRDHFGSGIHDQPFFLPWHRWYILALENLLRQIDCNITVPYWDWSLEPQTWQNSVVWAAQCGLGGNGGPGNDYVTTGLFHQTNWLLTPSAGGRLQRQFNGNVPDCASVAMIQRSSIAEFDVWHTFISSNLHDAVHCNIGGTMCSRDSANAPEFFFHHGFIDKLWADWQARGPEYRDLPYYSQNTNSMPGAFGYSPRTVYNLDNQPGCVHVCIEPSAQPCRLNTTYTPVCPREMGCYEYSPLKLAGIIPRPYPIVPSQAHDLFNTSQYTRVTSIRFSELFTEYDQLYSLLRGNGYDSGYPIAYRPTRGQLYFDRYILQPPSAPYLETYVTSTSTQYPAECKPYQPQN